MLINILYPSQNLVQKEINPENYYVKFLVDDIKKDLHKNNVYLFLPDDILIEEDKLISNYLSMNSDKNYIYVKTNNQKMNHKLISDIYFKMPFVRTTKITFHYDGYLSNTKISDIRRLLKDELNIESLKFGDNVSVYNLKDDEIIGDRFVDENNPLFLNGKKEITIEENKIEIPFSCTVHEIRMILSREVGIKYLNIPLKPNPLINADDPEICSVFFLKSIEIEKMFS